MAIRTLPSQERYSNKNSKGGTTESRRKLKKLKSVKVANLDRLRLSIRRDRTRFNPVSSPSESSSSVMSETSSPNYMKATTSSSARKASSSSRPPERQNTPASRGKSGSKFRNLSVEQCSDPAGVNIPVEIRPGRNLKRLPSVRRSKKLSSAKSMKIRAKYSQFPDAGIGELGSSSFEEGVEFEDNVNVDHDGGVIREEPKKKGFLQRTLSRSKSIRLTRLRSGRSSRRTKSRLGGGETVPITSEAVNSNAEPKYMKPTSSQEARMHTVKGLTRTSSWGPLRILAKIPSLRPRRIKVRKRPQVAPLPGINVDRATCSSVLKSSKFPDQVQLNSGGFESEGISSFHVCPYNYCSLHGHNHHHAPTPPLKEFISAKRKSAKNQKGKRLDDQPKEAVIHSKSVTETHHLEQTVEPESPMVKEMISASTGNNPEVEDDGMDFLIKVYAKPRKKWVIEGSPRENAEAFNVLDRGLHGYYEWNSEDVLGETTRLKARDEALNEGKLGLSMCNIEWGNKTQQQNTKFAEADSSVKLPDNGLKSSSAESEGTRSSLKDSSHISSANSETSSGGDLINILSDKQKYSSIWHLIYHQFVPSEESMAEKQEIKSLGDNEDNQIAVREKIDYDETAAIKLVQEALDAILQRDGQSSDQQAIQGQAMCPDTGEKDPIPAVMSEESFKNGELAMQKRSLESQDKMHKVEQEGGALQKKAESDEGTTPARNMSKSLSKLRKLIVTAKFIKAMEKLRKISPGKPQYLPSEPTSEDERVYFRHLSMNEKKNVEEWMLDFALRKVVSRLGPEEQRRVASLVQAFETFTSDNNVENIKCYPMKEETAPENELATPEYEEKEEHVESNEEDMSISDEQICMRQNHEASLDDKGIPEERCLGECGTYETSSAGDKILQRVDETGVLLESSGNSTTSVDRAFEEPVTGNEVTLRTLEAPFQLPIENSEANPAVDISTILFDQKRYTGMWNMIYQHVTSSEASIEGKQGGYAFHEKDQGSDANTCQDQNDVDSIQSSYSTDHEEDEANQGASREKQELNQSAAIRLVKEAINAILQPHELSSDQQSITDETKTTNDARELNILIPTYSTERSSEEGDQKVMEPSEPEGLGKKDASLQQVEAKESEEPPKKMSKSLSRLKKAIVTTKFIKAMERLRKINLQKTRHPNQEAASEEERIHLRNLSMGGKKNSEEWMLDYALRKVISKLPPDQQKKVVQLVEAFETITPGQKEGTISYPLKDQLATGIKLANPTNKELNLKQLAISDRESSILDDKGPQELDDGFPLSQEIIPARRSLPEDIDQVSRTDDKVRHGADKSVVSNSTLERSKNHSTSVNADAAVEELSTGDAENTISTSKVTSTSPTENSEVSTAVDMTTILSDKQKYTNMWTLIYQHAASSKASTAGKQTDNEAQESEQDEDANSGEEMSDLNSNESYETTTQAENENTQNADCKDHEMESAAIKMVREAINAILQAHEMRPDEQPLEKHDIAVDSGEELHNNAATSSTEESPTTWKMVEKRVSSETEDTFHKGVNENASVSVPKKTQRNELQTPQRSSSANFRRLKKVFMTAKFMKAMERMRRITPREPRYLSPEAVPEEERVSLRHHGINERRNAEEWMLDYALRKVISSLAPEQQRRVASLVEAFETVTPEQKSNGVGSYMKTEGDPAIGISCTSDGKQTIESDHDNGRSYDDHICPNPGPPGNKSTLLGETFQLRRTPGENHPAKISNLKTKSHDEVLDWDDNNLQSHLLTSSRGCPEADTLNMLTERKDIGPNLKSESLKGISKQDHEPSMATKGIFSDTQKHASMWSLIYQHAKSVVTVETESSLSEGLACKDLLEAGSASSRKIADADADDSDASSVTSELTESEAVKLVREAIRDILAAPQELNNECNVAASDEAQTTGEGKTPEKTLSRGFSKLRKVIICRKFIKAMEKAKTRNTYPQKRKNQILNADQEAEKINLKPSGVGEKKSTDELLLDSALQKVIAELAPVQQRRVALLVEAFEKVKPETEETGRRFNPKLQESATSSREVATDKALEEMHEVKDTTVRREDWSSNSSSSIIAATSDVKRTLSNDCKDATVLNSRDSHVQHEEASESLEQTCKQDHEANVTKGIFSDTQKHTSMWQLIYQHAKNVTAVETESSLSEEVASKDQLRMGNASSEMTADGDPDDSDASSVASELTESEAVRLVREAISDILAAPQELVGEILSSNVATSDEDQGAGDGVKPEKTLSRGFSKLRKIIICRKFIKAMEKANMRTSYAQKHKSRILNADQEAEKVNLKPSAVGEKKSKDELLLDHALQKVIEGLAPVQQRWVALLVQAFEKVNPDTEETGKKFSRNGSSAGNAKEKVDPMQQGSLTSSSREGMRDNVLKEMQKEEILAMPTEEWKNKSATSITAATSDVKGSPSTDRKDLLDYSSPAAETTENSSQPDDLEDKETPRTGDDKSFSTLQHNSLWGALVQHIKSDAFDETSNDYKGATELSSRDMQYQFVQREEVTSVDTSFSEPTAKGAESPTQPEDLKDEGVSRTENDLSFNKVRHTSLWRLLVQHVKSDTFEETETQRPGESDADAVKLHESHENDQCQPSSEADHEDGMNVPMLKSNSFELQEREAIKVVQEALDAILTCDDQPTTPRETSDQDNIGGPSPVTEETGVKKSEDSVAKPQEEQRSEEKLSNSYSKLSNVILCRRFIKAMDKMRKLKPQSRQDHSQQLQSEEKSVHRMRQTPSGQGKNWEEWMLDHAMQQVVGNLAPAQKKRVSLLVQAFEKVSQPEPGTGQKGKVAGF